MRRLYISIVFAVLGSLFIISWGLDALVEEHADYEDSSDIVLYKKLIEGISQQLNLIPHNQLSNEVKKFSQYYQIDISLEQASNVALPESLSVQLSQTGGLLLASESNPYLLRKLNAHPDALIEIHLPTDPIESQNVDIILTSILYLGVCSIIILWLFPLTRRLFILTSVAEKIGEGNLELRVSSSKYSYIRSFENSFNQMAAKIEKLVNDNQILARSLSHDIRTPMSCLRFGVEAALDAKSLEKKDIYINRMEAELTRMEDMTSAFLEYAGMERKAFNLKKETVDINDFLQNVTDELQSLAQQYNIALIYHKTSKPITALIDEYWCQRAIQNLVGNAVQYASKSVYINITSNSNLLTINIEDDGKGIPENKLDVIFDPFVKLDTNRSRENGHFGLGLAICAKVMDWHQGKIVAKNSTQYGGASFSLSFPLKK
ncbi:sensor histidine kinase [Pseudocolwellia agarivorans]|uniref:sensor histidine kinase n=1 Tax=Pseudocolwellia agarivorans TaxID=1911682 RepID=UPI00098517CA|nr:ATP-binding protein [Pseudocolwellia agarivorans]